MITDGTCAIPEDSAITLLEQIIKLNKMDDQIYEIFKSEETEICRVADSLTKLFFSLTGIDQYLFGDQVDIVYEMIFMEKDIDNTEDLYEQLIEFKNYGEENK